MGKPLVAIVGRPNVGKSTLFNRLVGRRTAIVLDTPGVTRDRNYGEASWRGRAFVVVDTGGFEPLAVEGIGAQVREQATLAIEEADLVILLLDGLSGCTPDDKELVEVLRQSGRPFLLVVNKIDGPKQEEGLLDFYALGVEPLYAVSAEHSRGVGDFLDALLEKIPEVLEKERLEGDEIRFAVIGRPNVGKSSLINKLLGMERTLVSEAPGTTRDAIDTEFEYEGLHFVAIDTAGVRRKARVKDRVEAYSVLRALRSLERCDVACLLIDAAQGITEQDIRIAGYTEEAGRALVLLVNKWDLVEKETGTSGQWVVALREKMPFVAYAPVLFISALTGQRVQRLLPTITDVAKQHRRRVPTAELNECVEKALHRHGPPQYRGRPIKVLYAAQVGLRPPTFALVVNHPVGVRTSYRRYLMNQVREAFGFEGTPIKLRFRKRRRRRRRPSSSGGLSEPVET
jgi:GTP-binding protein